MTLEEVQQEILRYVESHDGKVPIHKEILQFNPYLTRERLKKYGGYLKIINDLKLRHPARASKESIYQALDKYIKTVGYVPTQVECRDQGVAQNHSFDRFGGYKQVLFDLGYEYPKWRAKDYTKNEMKEAFLKLYEKAPSIQQVYDDYKLGRLPFNMFVIRTKFGSLNGLVKYCGLEFNQRVMYYYTDQELIDMFIGKYGNDAPPLQEVVNADYHNGTFLYSANMTYSKYGSYGDFLKLCGYETFNNGIYGEASVALDGHKCDSKAEKLIDDFLFTNNIPHEAHVLYRRFIPNHKHNHKCDWVLTDGTVIEYFGLQGQKQYDIKTKNKIKILNNNKIKSIFIYPDDINHLDILFADYI